MFPEHLYPHVGKFEYTDLAGRVNQMSVQQDDCKNTRPRETSVTTTAGDKNQVVRVRFADTAFQRLASKKEFSFQQGPIQGKQCFLCRQLFRCLQKFLPLTKSS
jgi:hypothetical protein